MKKLAYLFRSILSKIFRTNQTKFLGRIENFLNDILPAGEIKGKERYFLEKLMDQDFVNDLALYFQKKIKGRGDVKVSMAHIDRTPIVTPENCKEVFKKYCGCELGDILLILNHSEKKAERRAYLIQVKLDGKSKSLSTSNQRALYSTWPLIKVKSPDILAEKKLDLKNSKSCEIPKSGFLYIFTDARLPLYEYPHIIHLDFGVNCSEEQSFPSLLDQLWNGECGRDITVEDNWSDLIKAILKHKSDRPVAAPRSFPKLLESQDDQASFMRVEDSLRSTDNLFKKLKNIISSTFDYKAEWSLFTLLAKDKRPLLVIEIDAVINSDKEIFE